MFKPITIKVPASTANLGPGFDSLGLALSLYLTLDVEPADSWLFTSSSPELQELPTNESHFIFQVVKQVCQQYATSILPAKVNIMSDIPLARGLGSSASAIVAGIELANHLGELNLTKQDKLQIATEIEGHPDNVGASLFGGLVVGSYLENQTDVLSFSDVQVEVVAVIPKTTLLTKESRQVLPKEISFSEAVAASSLGNLLVAALLSENWEIAGKMMKQDIFHHPYRKKLIPFFDEVEQFALANGAFGVAISGAGPTVLCFTEQGKGKRLESMLELNYREMDIRLLTIDRNGSRAY